MTQGADMRGMINPTQALILGALQSGKKSGAQIIEVAVQIRGFWNSTRSQVYREMPGLEAKGYIKVIRENVPAQYKELYQILEPGKHAYHQWVAESNPADLLRNPWMLRYVLAEHDGSDAAEVSKSAAEYYRRARLQVELEPTAQVGVAALASYYRVMEDWFTSQVA